MSPQEEAAVQGQAIIDEHAKRIEGENKERDKAAFLFTQEAFNFVVHNMPIGQESYARDADAVLKHILDALDLSEEDFQEA